MSLFSFHRCLRASLLAVVCLGMALPAFAQEEREKGDGEKDDPRARQQYLEELRGADTGIPPGARLKALHEMDEMIRQEGNRYWRDRGVVLGMEQSSEGVTSSSSMSAAPEGGIAGFTPSSGQWLFIGPRPTKSSIDSSGRVTAMVVDSRDSAGNSCLAAPATCQVYIGAAQGGVWKSTDGGANWTPLTDQQASLATGSMAIDTSTNPSTVYVGTGEQGFSFDSYYGAGVLRSTDGGTTWNQLGAAAFAGPIAGCGGSGTICGAAFIGGLAVRPGITVGNPANLLAAVSLPTGFLGGPGVYRSIDGGSTWTNVLLGTTSLGATSVQYASNSVAYAGMDGQGIFKSTNGGANWSAANGLTWNSSTGAGGATDITTTSTGRVEFAIASDGAVYASVGFPGGTLAGFYKTTDGGDHWTKLGPSTTTGALHDYCGQGSSAQCWYDNVVVAHPTNANVVFVGGNISPNGVMLTADGGTTWSTAVTSIHPDHHAGAFTPDGSRLYWGNDGGVYSTTNTSGGAVTWTNLNSMLGVTQFYSYFALHPSDINITFAGAQDNGTQRYDGTQDISLAWTNVTCGDGAGNVIDQSNPSIVYANCQNFDVRKSTNGGLSGFLSADNGISTSDRVTFIPPMVGDNNPGATNFIYFGTHQVYQTRDSGTSWQRISNDVTNGSSSIANMAVAPSDRSVMYVVTRSGRVAKGINLTAAAPNDCATLLNCFTDVTGTLTPANRRINAVAVSPTDPNTVYVGHSGFGSTTQHLSKSTSGGSTWTNVTGNLPNTPVNDIVVDPDIAGTLYVGTDIGVFRSTDDGGTWSTLANGLPRVAVYGLKLHRPSRTLRAATHGRGFWDLSVPVNIVGAGGVLSPSSLSFTSRPLSSTSPAQNISFTNNGTAPTTVSNVTASGDFTVSSNGCTSPIAPAGSCAIGVTFTPTAAGPRSGTLTVTSNAVNSPATANLSGMGAPPNDDFANAIVVSAGTFSHATNTLGATVEAGDPLPEGGSGCPGGSPILKTVWYYYTPATSGQATVNTRNSGYDTVLSVWTGTPGAFSLVDCNDDINNVANSPSELILNLTGGTTYRIMVSGFVGNDSGTLNLSVTGPAPVALNPSLTITPGSLTFGSQVTSTTSGSKAFTLTAANGTVNNIAVDAATGDFSRVHNCPASLTVSQTCTVAVTFTPSALGARTGAISVTSTGTGSPQAVNLSGTGISPTLGISPAGLTFTNQAQGTTSSEQTIVLTGTNGPVTGLSVGTATGDFARTTTCAGTLAWGASCAVSVTFTPTAAGTRNGSISITSSAAGSPQSVTLTGTGDTISVLPASLNLSAVVGRANAPQAVVFFNGSGGAVTFSSISVTGDYTQTNTCVSVPNGGSCTINVTFTPAASGARNGILTVASSAGTRTATLNGTGVEFSLSLARPTRSGRGSNGADIAIEPGQSMTMDLQVEVEGGRDELISLDCSGATGDLTCALEPQQVRLGSSAQLVKVRISALAHAGRLGRGGSRTQVLTIAATMMGVTRIQQVTVGLSRSASPTLPKVRSRRLTR